MTPISWHDGHVMTLYLCHGVAIMSWQLCYVAIFEIHYDHDIAVSYRNGTMNNPQISHYYLSTNEKHVPKLANLCSRLEKKYIFFLLVLFVSIFMYKMRENII